MDTGLLVLAFAAVMLGTLGWVFMIQRHEKERQAKILAKRGQWSDGQIQSALNKKISAGMTEEMVLLAWGQPANIDKREITKSGLNKERWVYGRPRKGASYVYFSDGEVQKVQA